MIAWTNLDLCVNDRLGPPLAGCGESGSYGEVSLDQSIPLAGFLPIILLAWSCSRPAESTFSAVLSSWRTVLEHCAGRLSLWKSGVFVLATTKLKLLHAVSLQMI